jgi:tRNA pseudouridine38-40 synthase
MPRYFLEISYHGARYAGFQIQENAHTVQEEVERALETCLRTDLDLTGSSRSDSGVHAASNFFHFDVEHEIDSRVVYNLNAVLPHDISVKSLRRVRADAHCRFDAISRSYIYTVYRNKDPFLQDRAYYYPYTLNMDALHSAAAVLEASTDFSSFSKRNTQVKTFICSVNSSRWIETEGGLQYHVEANRFLRGMVRGMVATMLRAGRGRLSNEELLMVLAARDNSKAWFDVPGHGLILKAVHFDWNKTLE